MYFRLVVAVVAVFLVYRVVRWLLWLRRVNKALANVPVMGEPHWLLGNIRQIRADGGFVEARAKAFEKLGVGTLKAYLGPVPILVTRDIDMYNYIHKNQSNSATPFIRVDAPMLNRVVGDSAFLVSDGAVWAFHRKNLDPLFRHQNLNSIYPMVVEYCQRMEQLWMQECDKNPITKTADIFVDDQLKSFSTGIIAYLAFNTDIGVLKTNDIHPMVQRFTDIAKAMECLGVMPPLIQKISWLPERRILEHEVAKADEEMLNTIKMRRTGTTDVHGHKDVLDLLLNPELSPPYTDRCIRDQCITLYWAGQETTSLFMTWGLYYLAHHPDVQQKLLEALQELPESYTYDQLNRVEYLTHFVNETLRLASVAPSTLKQSSTDATEYNGLQLPAGLWLLSSIHDIQHNPEYFPDPLKFDPNRWADPKLHSMDAFVAFTRGEKICIGQKLALMEGKAFFAHAISKFKITEVPGFEVAAKNTFVCRPKNGMKLRISVRV